MANCSIPNSTPAIGRTSTPLSRQSRRQNSAFATFFTAFGLRKSIRSQTVSFFNVQCSTSNAQRPIRAVGCWTLGVRRWAFSASWRVKGAWWSSRSSKPLSVPHTRDRGRFDSYPLRRLFNTQRSTLNPQRSIQTVGRWTLDVGRWAFSLRVNHCEAEIKNPSRFNNPQSAVCNPQWKEGGEHLCRVNKFENLLRFRPVRGELPN